MNYRYSDVLISLYFANQYGQNMFGRIQLQKLIYLADILSVIWSVISPKQGHETYKFGPYDRNIQNAVDALVFRGFVDIAHLDFSSKSKIDVRYGINKHGKRLYEKLASEDIFSNKNEMYNYIALEVNKRSWNKLKSMVYAEPSYLSNKTDGYGYGFDHMSLFKNSSLRILYDFQKMLKQGKKISKKNMVAIFFKLIEE